VKKKALSKAGIGYHEIVTRHTTQSELGALAKKLVPAG